MTHERRILLWMCVLVAVNQLGFGAMIPSLPLYAQTFGVGASAIGLAVGIYGLARFLIALPSGGLADGIGRRPTIALGGIISGLGNLWCAWASSFPEFIIARFVAGAGAGLIVTTGQVVLADISKPAERGRMLALYQGTFIFAVGVGPFPGGLLAQHVGLAAPFVAYGCLSLTAALIAWFAVAETRGLDQRPRKAGARPVPFTQQMRELSRQIGFVLVSVIALMNAVARTGGLFSIVPVLANEQLRLSASAIGFAMMLGSMAGLAAAYPAGWITDRFGRKAVIVPATVITGLSMLLFCWAPGYGWFTAACLVWGVAISVGASAPTAYAADSAPPGMNASAISIYRMVSDAGYMIGPPLLGLVVDHFGAVAALVLAAVLVVLSGLVFGLLAPESYRGSR